MQELSRDDIIGHDFTRARRKGYNPLEVDGHLERIAEYVGWMQAELARHRASERTALEVLQQAQRVADETMATAQRDAEKLRRNAAAGLENARRDARSMLDAARAEADSTLLSAQAQAESAIEQSSSQVAEFEAAGLARLDEANRLVEKMKISAAECASDFRSAGSRLIEMADQFESEFDAPREGIGMHDDVAVELDEPRVEVA
jgi:DivIVA domain-containing protein